MYIGYPITLAVGLALVEGDYHWSSDIIAGALIGHVIGRTIGNNFRNRVSKTKTKLSNNISFIPLLNRDNFGLTVMLQF